MKEVAIALFSSLSIIIPAILLHRREMKKLRAERDELKSENAKITKDSKENKIKLDLFDKVLDLTTINNIKNAIDRIFDATIADRFLIMIAINGKEEFNSVSVIFEQHQKKDFAINATARYKNISIDSAYRDMLKKAERERSVSINVEEMNPCMLRDFYELENVKYSRIRHLLRVKVDRDSDIVVYSSLATHDQRDFNRLEISFIKTQYEGSVIPDLINLIKK